ncbi:DUF3240 family protein [Congregibacter sp.]|uniref:DUF3240 family protein n=1 Tax=Congregibacter sp. TaxID=2744308 RepID=UPI003F6CC29E
MNGDALLVLLVPQPRRDDVVDALMSMEAVSGFSVTDAAGFSRAHSQLNRRELVQGYGDYERFEVLCDEETRRDLFQALKDVAGRDHFRYWVMPVLEDGTVGQ